MSTFAAKKLLRKYSMLLEQSVYVYIVFVIAYINAQKILVFCVRTLYDVIHASA